MMFPDGFASFWALRTPVWVLDHLREASRRLSHFWGIRGEKSPEKKVSTCVWRYFGRVCMMFADGFVAFWALET